MTKSRRFVLAIGGIGQLCLLLIACTRPAYAYADPGSGLLMVQIGGSMMAGVLFYIRHKIRRLFGLRSSAEETSPDNDGTHDKAA